MAIQLSTELTPYSSAAPFFGAAPTWLSKMDGQRLLAYQLYEQIYKNTPDTFQLVQRGTDANPIYLLGARKIIETVNRFLAKKWKYSVRQTAGTTADQETVRAALQVLFAREKMYSKFAMNKRWGLIRGDSLLHVVADLEKPQGRRISIYDVDPGMYFPIYDITNLDRVIGCHLVEQIMNDKDEVIVKRQTYRKLDDGTISSATAFFELASWDDREGGELKPVPAPTGELLVPEFVLPRSITSIPVYHTKNQQEPGNPFGVSELQGMETILTGLNQGATDVDLALALEGLGVYVTTSSPPVNEQGEETTWQLGPGRVAEIDTEADFKRVQGVGSVTPWLEFLLFLQKNAESGVGVSDTAAGRIDVQVAESGIARALDLAPLIARCEEKEEEILAVADHFLFDLTHGWLPEFEGVNAGDVQVVSVVNDPMPVNRKEVIEEITGLITAKIIDTETARLMLTEQLGMEFPDQVGEAVVAEQAKLAEAGAFDPFSRRVAEELEGAQDA